MATKAYFMVDVADKFCPNGYQDVLRGLAEIDEIQCVERVDGICDLLVKVNTPVKAGIIADKILNKEWVKSLRVLNVEPAELGEAADIAMPEFQKVETALPSKQ